MAIATAASAAPPDKAATTVAKVALSLNLGIILGAPIGTFPRALPGLTTRKAGRRQYRGLASCPDHSRQA